MTDPISGAEFATSDGVEDWRVVGDGAGAFFRTRSFAESTRFVAAIGELSGIDAHTPAIDVRGDGVSVRLITYEDAYFGMSRRDADLARRISVAAKELGLTSDPTAVHSVLVIPGAPVAAEVMPFWKAVLGYVPRSDSPDEDLVDPHDRGPAFWFESMNEPRPDGDGAIHIAVWVPYDQAEARVAAALAAGGRMVRDMYAPAWWTLADSAGNEADIATIKSRD